MGCGVPSVGLCFSQIARENPSWRWTLQPLGFSGVVLRRELLQLEVYLGLLVPVPTTGELSLGFHLGKHTEP